MPSCALAQVLGLMMAGPTWRRARPGELYTEPPLLSGRGRLFAPQWVWELPPTTTRHSIRGGHHAADVLISEVPVRNAVRILYCATAVITNTFNIECPVVSDSHKPPEPPEALHVVAFPLTPALADLYPHYLLDAAANVGLAAPLARAGFAITWLHTGLFDRTQLRVRTPRWLSLANRTTLCPPRQRTDGRQGGTSEVAWCDVLGEDASILRTGAPIPRLALAVAVTTSPHLSNASFELNGFAPTHLQKASPPPPPETRPRPRSHSRMRQPEPQRPWLPLSAYALPFDARARQAWATRNRRHTRGGAGRAAASDEVGLIRRGGARPLTNEREVVDALMPRLAARSLKLRLLNASEHTPHVFASLVGVVGVHGSALGNLHAMAPGALVVEITGASMPRTWSNFAVALGHHYWAYVSEQYPRSLWSFHRVNSAHSQVRVNATRLAAFVASAWDATLGVEL